MTQLVILVDILVSLPLQLLGFIAAFIYSSIKLGYNNYYDFLRYCVYKRK